MNKLQTIDFAVNETLKAYPGMNAFRMIYLNILNEEEVNYSNFTRANNARKSVIDQNITQDDLLQFVLEEVVKCYNAMIHYYNTEKAIKKLKTPDSQYDYFIRRYPHYNICRKAVEIISNPNINAAIYYAKHTDELTDLVVAVTQTRYHYQPPDKNETIEGRRRYVDNNGYGITYVNDEKIDLFSKIREDFKKKAIAARIEFNQRTVNNCLLDIMSGSQLKHQRNEYGLGGNLFASQDIGKRRQTQEDAVIILTHPENPEFKLLAVSDGMGGVEHGEIASKYTIQQLAKWFQNLPKDVFYYPLEVQKSLNDYIQEISRVIYNEYNSSYKGMQTGATLVAGVVTAEDTIISSIGDSRAYALQNGQLELLTKDESGVWPVEYAQASDVPEYKLDELRFKKGNNKITRSIGWNVGYSVQTCIVPNESYDRLLLFSDGVTDVLSQERIKVLSTHSSKETVTRMLVDEALNYDIRRKGGEDQEYNALVQAGKDNATAAMYARR